MRADFARCLFCYRVKKLANGGISLACEHGYLGSFCVPFSRSTFQLPSEHVLVILVSDKASISKCQAGLQIHLSRYAPCSMITPSPCDLSKPPNNASPFPVPFPNRLLPDHVPLRLFKAALTLLACANRNLQLVRVNLHARLHESSC